MKKIIIACDSYKGCLTSKEVNEAMALGVKSNSNADASEVDSLQVVSLEMSDGGEGMLDAFLSAMGGERMMMHAHDALMRWIDAAYGIVRLTDMNEVAGFKAGDEVAIIEIAQAAGLALIEPEQRNPMKATSWGVGEMILSAYRRGIRKFIVGLGGSATSDCGIGMLKAMGDDWKKIRKDCTFVLASDVTNPLCGQQGAAHVFAPQKGADAEMVEMLDKRAEKFAEVSAKHFGYDKSQTSGAGAAGGLGYAFLEYFNAEFQPGAELLLQAVGFDELLKDADLVITGEGHSDKQTLMGKLPQRILEHCLIQKANAQKKNISLAGSQFAGDCKSPEPTLPKVWLVSGGVSDEQALLDAGFDRVVAVTPESVPLQEAVKPEVAKVNIAKALDVLGF